MSLESELLEVLAADVSVSAIVGHNLRQEWRDDNDRTPAVVASRISTTPANDMALTYTLYRARIQFDCFADTFEQVSDLHDAVRDALHGYTGSAGGFDIDSITFENSTSLGEQVGDRKIRRFSLDFFVNYTEG